MAGNTEELLLKIRDLEKEVAHWKSQVKEQRYGLNWIDVPEAFDQETENSIPILEEVPEKAIKNDDGKPTHILIEGDNYHALTCLNYTHKGKIDVIYIDPPYNTGSDGFTYKDKRILDKYPDGTAVPKDSPLRHSYWLSFMSKRLELAKKLMKETGAIFISINEDEYSQLKLLCDQIFGPQNYITSFTIKVRHEDRILKGDKPIHETTEMLLFYQKSDKYVIQKRIKDTSTPDGYEYKVTELKSADEIIELGGKQVEVFRPGSYKVEKVSADFSNLKMINIRGSIKAGNSSGRFHMSYLEPRKNEFSVLYKVPNMGDDGLGYRYFISRKNEKQLNGSYFQGAPVNRQDSTEIPYPNFFDFEQAFNDVGGEGGVPFDGGKKPIEFIQNFLKIANGKDELTILDFFGGSGSTGHAVIDCNKKHKFILVQTPDLTYELVHGKKIAKKGAENVFNAGYERIIDVTYQREKNVIQGYTNAKGEFIPGLGNSLKYYRTSFVGKHCSKEALDSDKMELAAKAGCLIALAEQTMETVPVEKNCQDFFQLYSDNNNRYTAIYFNSDYDKFDKLVNQVESIRDQNRCSKFNVYVFSWDQPDIFENEFHDLRGITIKGIPQPILEIYKAING